MRLWTLHPKHLDAQGLVSVWRKALLARQILRGHVTAYKNHPQLDRFKAHPAPLSAINAYLAAIHKEAGTRGYSFDKKKLGPVRNRARIKTTDGQLAYEWKHLRAKLKERSPKFLARGSKPSAHPLFLVGKGPVQDWERVP